MKNLTKCYKIAILVTIYFSITIYFVFIWDTMMSKNPNFNYHLFFNYYLFSLTIYFHIDGTFLYISITFQNVMIQYFLFESKKSKKTFAAFFFFAAQKYVPSYHMFLFSGILRFSIDMTYTVLLGSVVGI